MKPKSRHPRLHRFLKISGYLFVALLLYLAWQIWDIQAVGQRDLGHQADCAVVLGAAAWYDKPSPVLRERLNHAVDLYHNGRVGALILTGGYGEGASYSESQVSRDYCIEKGVPAQDIRIEKKSGATLENLKEAKTIAAQNSWNHILLVSDPWHLKRALAMADSLGLHAEVSATRTSLFKSFDLRARFIFKELILYHQFLILGR